MGRLSAQMGFETALFLSQSVSHVNNTRLFTLVEISCVTGVYASVFVVIEGKGKVWQAMAHKLLDTHITKNQPSYAQKTHMKIYLGCVFI